jgi:SAM-dependent methyltransferase
MNISSPLTQATDPPPTDLPARVQDFFSQQWALYQKILDYNYMSHQQFYVAIHQRLKQNIAPFRLLELGCGDASLTCQALKGTTIASYVGVDLAAPALALATENLANLAATQSGFSSHVYQGDFRHWLPTHRASYDLILASFSLHHLSLAEKEELLGQIRAHLQPCGQFLLLDVMRQPDEDRPAYLQRYFLHMQEIWTQLQPQEIEFLRQHIAECDFPETLVDLEQLAQHQGFQTLDCLAQDPAQTAGLLACRC